ncbi:hypothetical protein ACFOYU_19295 [Microvirga sp. GCM10011540]|uniref:hypothetical protein n=1 Tax=Microvirga sp. GCM10011540 TaxID=3317338 RepID=UPI00361D63C0
MPGEGETGGGGGGDGGSGGSGGPNYSDIEAILRYLGHLPIGKDGDFTGNAGYFGDNIGPVGSKEPEKYEDQSTALINALMTSLGRISGGPPRARDENQRSRGIEPYSGATMPRENLFSFVGADVDIYSGLPLGIEDPNPFTGLPASDPFAKAEGPERMRSGAPFGAIRQTSLLSSPYLLAENDTVTRNYSRAPSPPTMKSDFNQSSVANLIQAETDESYAAIQALTEGKARIIGITNGFDVHAAAAKAVQMAQSDEYRLASTVNQLRDHPLEIRHSAVSTGLGHFAKGVFLAGSGVLTLPELPPIGAMGLAAGIAQASSGLVLAFSGADITETIRMSGDLDYVFDLTSSPMKIMFGTTGLVLFGGDVEMSHRWALAGGIFEDLATLRGDPSKLYSALIPGVGTKAEKGASALLVKDVVALGYKARAESVEQVVAKLNRNFTVEELNAIGAFREELAASGRLDLAGQAGHAAAGAAGGSGGVDFPKFGGAFQQELKLHGPYTGVVQWHLDKASTQSLNYSIKSQLETRALGEQLVPIRSVKHIWISPTEAVKSVGR